MTCTCGDKFGVQAETREDAVVKIKEMMNEAMITQHMTEKHPGDPVPSVADVHAMIDQTTTEEA